MQDGEAADLEEEEEEDTPAWSRGHKPGSTVKRRFPMESRDSDGGDEVEDYDEEEQVSRPSAWHVRPDRCDIQCVPFTAC